MVNSAKTEPSGVPYPRQFEAMAAPRQAHDESAASPTIAKTNPRNRSLNARREAARIGERCKVLAARSIGHHRREAARRSHSTAPREAAQEAARNMAQGAARSIAQEAARNTHTGQRRVGRSGDRQRNLIRRRGQQKAVGPKAVGAQVLRPHSAHKTRRASRLCRQISK